MQVQRGRATGRVLYMAHHAKAAAGQLHQLVEQGIESGFGLGTGNEHRLRPRDGLQQAVLAGEHGLGGPPRAGAGAAFQHGLNLRRQRQR